MSADQTDSERESQLSAMFDGELPEGECELVARRLAKDENLRRSWDNYSLIGAVMRSEPLARRHLAPQIAAAVQADRSVATADAVNAIAQGIDESSKRRSPALRRAAGFGVAAAVGAVAIFIGVQPRNEIVVAEAPAEAVEEIVIPAAAGDQDEIVLAMKPATPGVVSAEPESYVTPPVRDGVTSDVTAPVQLANFVAAHSAVATPMLRHSTLSNLIASAPIVEEAPAQPAVASEDVPARGESF
ncbi:MAG: sigma-E factor negative regulatory protein [Steroidobacteraceae bacterium]|jgi:negative regulator of sigma E activity